MAHCFQKNGSGVFAGKVTTTAKKAKPKKMRQSSFMGRAAQNWRYLAPADRAAFSTAAPSYPQSNSLGQTYYLSGFQLYCKWSGNLAAIQNEGLGQFIDPTLPDNNLNPTSLDSIDFGVVAGIDIVLTALGGNTNTSIKVFASPAVSVGRETVSGNYKLLLVEDQQVGTYNIPTADFNAICGKVAVGQAVFFKIEVFNTLSGIQTQLTKDFKVVVVA